jgi:diaminobutyrate-2-oxoglutarate transaminase
MALVLIDRRYDEWLTGEHNGTFRGNCHAFVTARAALWHYWRDDGFETAIAKKASLLESGLKSIAAANRALSLRLKGRGMMRGLQLPSGDFAARVIQTAFDNGLVIETSGPKDEVVKCLAALTISDEELQQGLSILARSIAAVATGQDRAAA